MKILMVLIVLSLSTAVMAAETPPKSKAQDFDSLGGNEVLLEKARALNPDKVIGVVQNRAVPRRNRLEFNLGAGLVAGGDPYLKTKDVGGGLNYHFIPQLSVGARYHTYYNELNTEAKQMIDNGLVPDVDHPKSSIIGMVDYYPIYGKLNLFDLGVIHYDIYVLAGYGNIVLKSGGTNLMTGGGGIGIWLSQHFTARLEVRYETFNAKSYTGSKKMDLTVADFLLGYLL